MDTDFEKARQDVKLKTKIYKKRITLFRICAFWVSRCSGICEMCDGLKNQMN